MEPLQSGHAFDRGKLRDPALETLLRGLARQSNGLCLITTREPLPDLAGRPGVAVKDLEQITREAGRALLRTARVVGTDAELEALAKRFGPHALAISLLGVYLHEKDPNHGTGSARALEKLPGKEPIDRVLAGFEQLLADSAELEVLRLLGLFDRLADAGCLGALRAKPAIPGLTDRVVKLKDADWDRVFARLEKLRLIHARRKESGKQFVDAHPLIREYFAKQLREQKRDAWRAAHRRLYEHLCKTTSDKKPNPTLEDLQPLYQAVAHGCQAGLQQEACDKVYFGRITRGQEFYSTKKLGAYGSDLGAVASFFEQPWSRVSTALTVADQSWVLGQAAHRLRALGRLAECLEPMRSSSEVASKAEDWENNAIRTSNLSEMELTLGEVTSAVEDAEQCVTYADRSGDAGHRLINRTTHADALHQAGQHDRALARFREAEQMQAKDHEYPLLYSVQGFRYCDLLLAASERAAWQEIQKSEVGSQKSELLKRCGEVEQRAAQTLKWATTQDWPLDMALDHLTLGCARLYKTVLEHGSLTASHESLDHAVTGFRRAGTRHYIPRGLLTRAWCSFAEATAHKLRNEHAQAAECEARAHADLDEAWEIAERGPMRLHMADIHLQRARLFSDKEELKKARALIEQCGYWRRKEELEDAEEAAEKW